MGRLLEAKSWNELLRNEYVCAARFPAYVRSREMSNA